MPIKKTIRPGESRAQAWKNSSAFLMQLPSRVLYSTLGEQVGSQLVWTIDFLKAPARVRSPSPAGGQASRTTSQAREDDRAKAHSRVGGHLSHSNALAAVCPALGAFQTHKASDERLYETIRVIASHRLQLKRRHVFPHSLGRKRTSLGRRPKVSVPSKCRFTHCQGRVQGPHPGDLDCTLVVLVRAFGYGLIALEIERIDSGYRRGFFGTCLCAKIPELKLHDGLRKRLKLLALQDQRVPFLCQRECSAFEHARSRLRQQ